MSATGEMTFEQGCKQSEIAASAIPLAASFTSGIYFLLLQGKVRYIGQAFDVSKRVAEHRMAGKIAFDSFAFIQCPRSELARLENYLIVLHFPGLANRAVPPGDWQSVKVLARNLYQASKERPRATRDKNRAKVMDYIRRHQLKDINGFYFAPEVKAE